MSVHIVLWRILATIHEMAPTVTCIDVPVEHGNITVSNLDYLDSVCNFLKSYFVLLKTSSRLHPAQPKPGKMEQKRMFFNIDFYCCLLELFNNRTFFV